MDAVTSELSPQEGLRAREIRAPWGPEEYFGPADRALFRLGQILKQRRYRFTTVTPASHARVLARPMDHTAALTDIFGWNRPFRLRDIDRRIVRHADTAGVLEPEGAWTRSCVRFTTLCDQLYAHSAYPTEQPDAVFFGPDTYRFCRVVRTALGEMIRGRNPGRPFRILDVGAGSGAGGLYAARVAARLRPVLTLTDINRRALRYCRVNAALNGIDNVAIVESDLFQNVDDCYDLIIANPPYLVDKLVRAYRHGGGALGSALSLRIVEEGVPHLAPAGRLVLYTGSAIVNGRDDFQKAVRSWARRRPLSMTYEEIDPDVFGEELDQPPYDHTDRIAAVSVTIDRPRR